MYKTSPISLEMQAILDSIESLISDDHQEDTTLRNYLEILQGPSPHWSKNLDLPRCSIKENPLYYDNLIYIPNFPKLKLLLLKNCHYHPGSGHHGLNKVFAELTRDYWWPGMLQEITCYTNNCHTCKQITPSRFST